MKILLTLILLNAALFGQDSTVSQAFKPTQIFSRSPLIKVKYPPYPLRAGFQLIKEANDGDPFAQHELGLRYILKQGFPADTVKGIYWLMKAVEKNVPPAQYNLGIMLNNGIGVDWNPFEAFYNFKKAAEYGMPESQFVYGLYYTDNFVVNRNYTEAYKWIKRAAEADYEPAKVAKKELESLGIGNAKDLDKNKKPPARNNTMLAGESSILMEQNWELDFYNFEDEAKDSTDDDGVQLNDVLNKDLTELRKMLGITRILSTNLKDTTSIGLIKFAADSGSPEAMLLIARGYEKGILFKKNLITAAERYLRAYRLGSQKAAEQLFKLMRTGNFFDLLRDGIQKKNADAMFIWAGLAAIGFDFQLTNEQAFELLQKAAGQSHVQSLIEIGLCYYTGKLVDQDKEKAIEYFQKAAELGSREAEVRIAFTKILENIDGKGLSDQIQLLESATGEGSVLAETALGFCYETGSGIPKDKARAASYYRRASQRGSETAYNSLKSMYDKIRPDEPIFEIYGD